MVCRLFVLVLMAVMAAGPAFAQTVASAPYQHAKTGIAFPATLGPLAYRGMVDYAKHDRPDLGISVRYVLPGTSAWADIYLYDLDRKNLGTGVGSPEVKKALAAAVQDVFAMEKQGKYRAVRQTANGEAALKTPGGQLPLLWVQFSYERLPEGEGGKSVSLISELYLTAYKDHFLKIRFSSPADMKDRHQEALKQFLADLGKVIK